MKFDMGKKVFRNYHKFVKLPLVLIFCYLLVFLLDPTREWNKLFQRDFNDVVREVVFTVVLCTTLIIVSLVSAKILDRWYPWEFFPRARFILQFGFQIIAAGVIFSAFIYILSFFKGVNTTAAESKDIKIKQGFGIYLVLSIFISFIYTGSYFFQQWKKSINEANELVLNAAKLKQITLEAELQALKMQLDPHFMFNNFSTLSALIAEDPPLAQLFLDKLSKVYRYMIISIPKNIVTLQEEMELAEAYFYLMKVRLAENIRMDISLEQHLLKKGIPPITIQLLIENALKHNMASKKRPLLITIKGDGEGNLLVINSLQRINYVIPSTKMGLHNIESRYKLLTERTPIIIETESEFKIKLPLIDLN